MSAPDLQFQHAEFPEGPPARVCSFCKSPVGDSAFQISGTIACAACMARVREMQGPTKRGSLGRAILYGLGAAAAGSTIFALVSLTGFQFSIVAILVGVMVGKAIRKGVEGQTTRMCQVLAVILTYGAITTSYVPMLVSTAMKAAKAKKAAAVNTDAPSPANPPITPKTAVAGLVAAPIILIAVSLVLPFLVLVHSPLSGLINLVIIFIGLRQAWRLTAPSGLYVPKL